MNAPARVIKKTDNQSPFDLIKLRIEDLYVEARLWLDGDPVTTQEQADALNTLENRIREAAKEAEMSRKVEARPFDDGKAEIQARYNPLIQKDKGKTDLAIKAIKTALKPYLLELDRQQREAAEKARAEAEEKQRAAMEAMRARDRANLEQSEEAERLVQDAKQAEIEAKRAEAAKAHAKGDGRASGLRSIWRPTMTDQVAAARWAWEHHNAELITAIQGFADADVRAGKRAIPGFDVVEHREI